MSELGLHGQVRAGAEGRDGLDTYTGTGKQWSLAWDGVAGPCQPARVLRPQLCTTDFSPRGAFSFWKRKCNYPLKQHFTAQTSGLLEAGSSHIP